MATARTHSESIEIAATPAEVYALVSDVTRTGEWSPVCKECWWDEADAPAPGDSPRLGAHFTGRNETPDRTWETRSQVVVADPGREFAWVVGQGFVRWGYVLRALDGGAATELTETWEFTPEGLAAFEQRYGEDAGREIEARTTMAHEGIPATLAKIKDIAES
ncbi:SRPBCC family protein [Isoptericola croceus]|uniref:SRPBCC family protein n=1 Tax=Isoptericola croceus TaxID=3031406 RepID=UPI0023F936CD|nr:SRPBCC family protein [Isoptericola croceus]